MVTSFRALVPVLLLSLVALTGCASGGDGATPSSSPSGASSPTSTTAPAADEPSAGEQVFGGACDAVLSVDDAGAVLGVEARAQSVPEALLPFTQSARAIGGLNCGWDAADESELAALRLTVLPIDSLTEQPTTEDNYCDVLPGEGECLFSIVEQGLSFSGTMGPSSDATSEEINAQISSLTSLITGAASEAGTENVPSPPALDGEWPFEVDCTALAQGVDAAALLAVPGLVLAADAPNGPMEAPPGYFAAASAAGSTSCTWFGSAGDGGGETESMFAYFLPGGSWIADEVAALPGAQELTGGGVERAILVTDPALSADRAQVLHVFDGANWLAITAGQMTVDESFLPFAAAVVAERNAE